MLFAPGQRALRFFAASAVLLAATLLPAGTAAQEAATPAGRVILVLPFDNRSGNPSLNWIGDSFPDTLTRRLNAAGFLAISHDDRLFAFDHLGLPADFRPSRATTIRIAQQLDANYVVVGSYVISNDSGKDSSASSASSATGKAQIKIQAQVLSVDQLRLSPPLQDAAELSRLFDAENGIAWQVARLVDPHFAVAESTFVGSARAVPLPAFESYIRGTNSSTATERLKRLETAVTQDPTYAAALLALGKEQYAGRDYPAAAATLARVPSNNPLALEANFYLGLARFNSTQYAAAAAAFGFVAERLPLSEVINDQAVALSRQDKDASAYFQLAATADPNDEDYHYNLAVSLARHGNLPGALAEADAALKLKPTDKDAAELRAAIAALPAGSRLPVNPDAGFTAAERIRRNYSETSYRQAAFQLDQMRAARLATLPPVQAAVQYTFLGQGYLNQGLMPEAEQQFASALAADPNNALAHAGMARVRESSGDAREARAQANAALALQPSVDALLVLARLDLAENQLAASAADVSRALALEPKNSAALAMRHNLEGRGQTVTP